MTQKPVRRQAVARRSLLVGSAGLISAAALAPSLARAQQNANLGMPATVISNPPRDFARGHPSISVSAVPSATACSWLRASPFT